MLQANRDVQGSKLMQSRQPVARPRVKATSSPGADSPAEGRATIAGRRGLRRHPTAGTAAAHSEIELSIMPNRSMPFSEAVLVRRINRALSDSGLHVRTDRRRSPHADLPGRHQIIFGARAFPLRVGIEELASSLGVLG